MAWATQYRPASLSQLDNVLLREQLEKVLSAKQFPHAILLTGPKGTGKTSSARILAALLNEEKNIETVKTTVLETGEGKAGKWQDPDPTNPLIQRIMVGDALSVMEVDAASYRGIDAIRSLKDRMVLPPTEGIVSVFILDEVHMLTTEAFNALLKMLEEPPAHVVFILATTELQKIPATVVSRCLVLQSKKASQAELVAALERVLKAEKTEFESGALEIIASTADGSFRDAVKLLEQALAGQTKLTASQAEQVLATAHGLQVEPLIQAVLAKEAQTISTIFQHMREQGVDATAFTQLVLQFLHDQLLMGVKAKTGEPIADAKVIHFLLQELMKVNLLQPSPIPLLALELALLDLVFRAQRKQTGATGGSSSQPTQKSAAEPVSSVVSKLQAIAPKSVETFANEVVPNPLESVVPTDLVQHANVVPVTDLSSGNAQFLVEAWDQFLSILKGKNMTIEAVLRTARPRLAEDSKLTIEVHYQFHKDQLQQPKFHSIVAECAKELAGGSVQLDYQVTAPTQEARQQQADELEALAKNVLIS